MRKYFVILVIAIGFSVCLWSLLIAPYVRAAERQRETRDRIYLRVACLTAKHVYERTGILYSDLASVEASPFFPFLPPTASCSRLRTSLTVRRDAAHLTWVAHIQGGYDKRPLSVSSPLLSPEERTRRQLSVLAKGPAGMIHLAQQVRAIVSQQMPTQTLPQYWRQQCESILLAKSVPVSVSLGVPVNVRLYESWLRRFWGDAMLSDAWGTQVRLRWEKDKLMVQSAGADRVWDTADDMTVERRLAD